MKTISVKQQTKGEKLLEEAMNNFNFTKVEKVMDFLDWRWGFINTVPEISDMKECIRNLYESTLEHLNRDPKQKRCSSSTGGFEVTSVRSFEGCEPDYVEIKFVLESWDEEVTYEK